MNSAAQPASPPVVIIGASAGRVEALVKLVGGLTDDLAAAVVVVLQREVTERAETLRESIGRSEAAVDEAGVKP